MHYLITGHTGFKGAWLTLWLTSLGHKVSGISLDPIPGALFETANVTELVEHDFRIDIRKVDEVAGAIKSIAPDVVFHMAAQPLVRESYLDPRGTIETNVMGTLNVIEAVSTTPSVRAHVVVTTDKVYRNVKQVAGYVESDPLGGDDPYSSSKAMADILAHSWVTSFNSPPTAIVRAGNVIGGGDVSKDRLVPDLISAIARGTQPVIRYPKAIRPWQHVLDCLNGYISIQAGLLQKIKINEINIGPDPDNFKSVEDVINLIEERFAIKTDWSSETEPVLHEAEMLSLNSQKAKNLLNWENKLDFNQAVTWTTDWFIKIISGNDPRKVTLNQIRDFLEII